MSDHNAEADQRTAGSGLPAPLGRGERKSSSCGDGRGKKRGRNRQKIVGRRDIPRVGANGQEVRGPDTGGSYRPCKEKPSRALVAPAFAGARKDLKRRECCPRRDQHGKQHDPQIDLRECNG